MALGQAAAREALEPPDRFKGQLRDSDAVEDARAQLEQAQQAHAHLCKPGLQQEAAYGAECNRSLRVQGSLHYVQVLQQFPRPAAVLCAAGQSAVESKEVCARCFCANHH